MNIVSQVQDAVKNGQKIADACARLDISDRSYQRWKKAIEGGNDKDS